MYNEFSDPLMCVLCFDLTRPLNQFSQNQKTPPLKCLKIIWCTKSHAKTARLSTLEKPSNAWPLVCLSIKQPLGEVRSTTAEQWDTHWSKITKWTGTKRKLFPSDVRLGKHGNIRKPLPSLNAQTTATETQDNIFLRYINHY